MTGVLCIATGAVANDCMAEIVPYNLPHFPHPCGPDAGGRATHGAVAGRWNDEQPAGMDLLRTSDQ